MESSGPSILVVDDDPAARDVAVRMLRKLGAQVVGVGDGDGARKYAMQTKFDVIFLDWELPDTDGREVASFLRSQLGDKVHLVSLSGYSPEEDGRDSDDSLFAAYLVKPVRLADFERVLNRFVPRT